MNNINLVKIWSDSIVDNWSNTLREDVINKLISDILLLREQTWEKFILLTSWAVAKWKTLVEEPYKFSKSSLASIWQHRVVWLYDRLIWNKNIVSQILIDDKYNEKIFHSTAKANWIRFDDNFKKLLELVREDNDKHLLKTIIDWVKNDVLTIVNYNDSMSSTELDNLSNKSDNDQNTVFLSKLINAHSDETGYQISNVSFLTNTNWLLDKENKTVSGYNFRDVNDELEFLRIKKHLLKYIKNGTSNWWTWWMTSKISSWLECLKYWVNDIIISNSKYGIHNLDNTKYTKITK